MEGGQRRGNAESELKPSRDVQDDTRKGDDDRDEGISLQFLAEARSESRARFHHERVPMKFCLENGHHHFLDLLLDGRRSLNADEKLVLQAELLELGVSKPVRLQGFSGFVDPDRQIKV